MDVKKIIESKENLLAFLKEKKMEEEKDYDDDEYKNGIYFKIDKRKLLVIYEIQDEEKLKEVKEHFLVDRGLSHCIIMFNRKLIFFRNYGERKHFIYSERTRGKASKIDRLNKIDDKGFDFIFQAGKDISGKFYESFKLKRNLLASSIENDVDPTEKYLIAQKIFDRFFFIYFLCHKGIIKFKDGRELSGKNLFSVIMLNDDDFIVNLKRLFKLFNTQDRDILEIGDYQIVIPYLNGGLFRPDILKQDLKQDLKIILKNEQWEGIFGFLNSYHWIIEDIKAIEEEEDKILTPEILGHVYERSVVEWEQKGFDEEAESAVKRITERKKKGVYYTPESITDYISNNTIKPYLLDRLEKKYNEIDDLIESENTNDIKKAIEVLDDIKVLDPACGSGAFLIKASEVLFALKRRLYYLVGKKKNSYDMKLDIITENIYGVDILSGAIEIAKLRFWLWLISDYEESKNKIQALPNIEYNLKVGNSLIGWLDEKLVQVPINTPLTDKVDGIFIGLIALSEGCETKDMKKARELLNNYDLNGYIEAYYILYTIYKRAHGPKAEKLRGILKMIRDSIYSTVSPAFLKHINGKIKPNYDTKKPPISNDDFDKFQAFHWRIDFGYILQNGGFDAIISNPPYIKEYNNKSAFDGIRWSEYYKGKMDIWYFFACRGIDLLKPNIGHLSFIAQNNWVTSYGASIMRNKVIKDTKIVQLLDFGDFKVFKDAGIQTMIMIFKIDKKADNYNIDYRKLYYNKEVQFDDVIDLLNKIENKYVEYLSPIIMRKAYIDKLITFSNNKNQQLLEKIERKKNFYLDAKKEVAQGIVFPQNVLSKKNRKILGDDFEVGQGIFSLNNEEIDALGLTEKEFEIIKPEYTTDDLLKYYPNKKNGRWVVYTDTRFKKPKYIEQYPNIKKHLDQFIDVITSDNRPYGLHRARNERFFMGEKIIAVRKCSEPTFTYTDFDCYVSATFYIIKSDRINMKFCTGLLNSNLIAFWLKHKGKMQGNNYQVDKEPLLDIPIYNPPDKDKKAIIKCVNQIISIIKSQDYLENEDKQEKILGLQEEIDYLVYNLYELTEDEIKIIEEGWNG